MNRSPNKDDEVLKTNQEDQESEIKSRRRTKNTPKVKRVNSPKDDLKRADREVPDKKVNKYSLESSTVKRSLPTDQSVPDLEAEASIANKEDMIVVGMMESPLPNQRHNLKRKRIEKNVESDDSDEECLDLEENVTSASKYDDGSDSDCLDLEVDTTQPKVVTEVLPSADTDRVHGRFAGRCTEHNSDSDPFEFIED